MTPQLPVSADSGHEARSLGQCIELVVEEQLGFVEKSADQRQFAVIDGAAVVAAWRHRDISDVFFARADLLILR